MIKQEKFYSIDFEKLKGESMDTITYFLGIMSYNEDYMYFDKIKHLLVIPEEPKTLEELQQELDEKFDDLLVKTKRKFAVSQQSAEYHYNQKFKIINDNFEYIKKWGSLPRITLIPGGGILTNGSNCLVADSAGSLSWSTEFKIGSGDAGYWICMPKKPNIIVRTFMRVLLGFKWVNKK
jgi:hypothetical protein